MRNITIALLVIFVLFLIVYQDDIQLDTERMSYGVLLGGLLSIPFAIFATYIGNYHGTYVIKGGADEDGEKGSEPPPSSNDPLNQTPPLTSTLDIPLMSNGNGLPLVSPPPSSSASMQNLNSVDTNNTSQPDVDTTFNNFNKAKEELNTSQDKLREKIESLVSEKKSLQEALDKKEKEYKELKSKCVESNNILNSKDNELVQANADRDDILKKIETYQKDLIKVSKQKDDLEEDIKTIRADNSKYRSETEEKIKKLEKELSEKIRNLKIYKQQLTKMGEKIKNMVKEKSSLKAEIDRLNEQIKTMGASQSTNIEKITKLEEEIKTLKEAIEVCSQRLNECKINKSACDDDLKSYLQKLVAYTDDLNKINEGFKDMLLL